MDCLTSITGSVAGKIVEYAMDPIVRQFGYLFYYKRNIQSLRDEVKRLDDQISGVQQLVEAEGRNLQDPMPLVKTWLEQARGTSDEIGQFLESEPARVNKGCCLNGWCPNLKSRYTVSRKAKKKTPYVIRLFETGNFPADQIAAPAQPPRIVPTLAGFQDFESRVSIMNKVMEALKKDGGDNLIRICGPGGVGKTTMVSKILNRVREEKLFDEVVMAVVSQSPDLKKIQDSIAGQLGLKLDQPTEDLRAAKLKERIVQNKKKFLLVLDDIWDDLPFEKIGLPPVASGGYKILFTSRSVGVLLTSSGDNRNASNFEVPTLPEDEAMHLFKKSAGDCCNAPDIVAIAEQVVNECGGVPIAIVTIGNALRAAGSSKSEWRDALRQLKSGKHGERVETCIKLSYNYLKCEEQKGFFLLCCLFPEDEDIPTEILLRYGMGIGLLKNSNYSIQDARDRVHTLMGQLRRSFLLLGSEKPQHVRMHDVVRDVGISIGYVDQECDVMNTCKYYENSDRVFGLTKLKLLWLYELQSDIGLNVFDGMKKLNVLNLSRKFGYDNWRPELPPFQFRGLENIQTLCLECYDLSNIDLSVIGELRTLEILSFYSSGGVMLPSKLGLLTRLRLLDCTNANMEPDDSIVQISYGVLSGLKQLENLYLGGNNEVDWIMGASSAEFRCLSNLTALAIWFPYSQLNDPNDFLHFDKLIKFQIGIGSHIIDITNWWGMNYEFPNTLEIKFTGEEKIDLQRMVSLTNILLKKTEILNVHREWYSSYDSNGDIVDEEEEYLLSSDCEDEENLFDLLGLSLKKGFRGGSPSLSHLHSLAVFSCHSLKYVLPFNIATELLQLKSLKVSNCRMIEEVFYLENSRRGEGEGAAAATITMKLPQLTHLELTTLPKLTALSKSAVVVELPQLMTLDINDLKNLKSVWTSTPLSSNTEPSGNHFILLPTDDDWTKQFQNLRVLEIGACPEVEVLFECEKLENGTNSILPQLQKLVIYDMPKLKHAWKNSAQARQCFQNLQILFVWKCVNMEYIVCGEGDEEEEEKDKEGVVNVMFPQLAHLQLSGLQNLVSFFSGNKYTLAWMSMKELMLEKCPNMKTFISSGNTVNDTSHDVDHYLFNEDVTWVKLRSLEIKNVCCEMIWHSKTQISVEEMKVSNCHKLKNVLAYSSGDGIKMVESLDVSGCDSLEVVFQIECELGTAGLLCNGLTLRGLPKLKRIWNISSPHPHLTIQAAQLKTLSVDNCPRLYRVFSLSSTARSVVVFPKLYDIDVSKCWMMEEIFGNDDEATTSTSINCTTFLPNLSRLKLKDNANLKSILKGMDVENIATQFSLEEITIAGCPKLRQSSFYFSLLNNSQLRTATIAFENQQVTMSENNMLIDGVGNLMDMLILDGNSTQPRCLSNARDVKLKNLSNFPAAAWWHYLQSLPNLVELEISSCGSTKVIFRLEEGLNPKKLPQLTELKLTCLEKLTCVWMKGIPRELSQRFQNLQELHVKECHNLRNLLTLSMVKHLPNLTALFVTNCSMVEEICVAEGRVVEDEGEDINNETIEFPRVKYLTLRFLPNFTSFCAAQVHAFNWPSLTHVIVTDCPRLETFTLAVSNTPKLMGVNTLSKEYLLMDDLNATIQLIFKGKVSVEIDEESNSMLIDGVEYLMDMLILNMKSTPPGYFSFVHSVTLKNLINFPAAAWWHYLQSLPNLLQLKISNCGSTEVIFRLDEGLNPKKLPQLTKLKLTCLEKLTCVWMKGIPRKLSQRFQNLRELHVGECHSLRNILRLSMVKHLPSLTTLTVVNCRLVEEICFTEGKTVEDEGVEINYETIEFPQLQKLTFRNLPKLTSFCVDAQVHAFNWHSLTEVVVIDCPTLETFTSAVSNTPKLMEVEIQSKKQPLMKDLNATIQLQLIFKEKWDQRLVLMKV